MSRAWGGQGGKGDMEEGREPGERGRQRERFKLQMVPPFSEEHTPLAHYLFLTHYSFLPVLLGSPFCLFCQPQLLSSLRLQTFLETKYTCSLLPSPQPRLGREFGAHASLCLSPPPRQGPHLTHNLTTISIKGEESAKRPKQASTPHASGMLTNQFCHK